ncbi:TPA: phage antirepressor KilAC domain-containing protein [Streptococcus agalactiae]|uniref:phage antirepressor KilAC domain-containing protein n=3 Tax=Streptococcus agalactiae TaxID=1311 RepID=UPI0002BBDC51|nr:phage antirepressor KilAC domain-containing protein [Streptococcus agalactiae]EPT95547.1 BRO-like protein [Streptococcus agalactiae BSU188]HEN6106108.1 phage antirepressor KilAC domain-containing protein [Streptococcus agalactiae]HEN6132243.1 phage antirepressor KilAC domain-containing protein [Streptococcus agalactiae]HEN6169497.1 phage antirepressor KilAC domain-containing protein [Streptococcus agalactiae]HEN6426219.1 phage antirepressor KilAC domain-containing protein [Streptococcus aga
MELTIINEQEVLGKHFTVYGTADEPLFLAKDVAEWIEHSKPSIMVDTVDEDEKLRETIFTSGQNREVWFLTENGLYEVLMQSRKPLAKEFKKKVKEILKSIRKHGLYAIDDLLENPDMAIAALQKLKEERRLRLQAQEEVSQKNQIIQELQPKATYYDLILQSESLVAISVIAKDYGMSAKKLNSLLHELKVQYKQGNTWLLYQKYASKGYTQSKTHPIDAERSKMHTYWTQKGRLFIYDLLKNKKGILPLIEQEEVA